MTDSLKLKLLYSAIGVLIILNASVIGIIIHTRGGGPGHRAHPTERVIRQLGFSEAQKLQFDRLREEHQSTMRGIKEENKRLHDDMFAQLSNGMDSSATANTIISAIADNIRKDETVTYHHLVKLRQICTPAQQKIFDGIVAKAMAQGQPGGPPPGD